MTCIARTVVRTTQSRLNMIGGLFAFRISLHPQPLRARACTGSWWLFGI